MRVSFVWPLAGLALLVGCGGGGGGTSASSGPDPVPVLSPVGSAKFTVDVATGEVKVEPISDSRAAFGGNALSLTSSTLLSEGSPERRVLRVTAKNNTKEPIGINGQFRVLFSNFQNQNTTVTDLRSSVRTATYWGNGTNSNVLGALSSSTIGSPESLAFDPLSESLFAASGGWIWREQGGTTSRYKDGTSVTAMSGYVAVATSTQIHIQDSEGARVLRSFGSLTSGTANGDFSTARFSNIRGLSFRSIVDKDEFELFIADGTKVRRAVISPSDPDGVVTDFMTSPGVDVLGVAASSDRVAYSSWHTIYITNQFRIGTVGFPNTPAFADGSGANARLNTPRQLAWQGSSLFVADSANNRVRQIVLRPGGSPYDATSYWTYTLSGSSTAGSTDGTGTMTHNVPFGIAAGPGESLFVSDNGGHRIRKITPISGRFTSDIFDGSANPTELAQLANPSGYVPSVPTRSPFILEEGTIYDYDPIILKDWQFTLPEGLKSFSFVVTIEAETDAPGVLASVSNTGTGTRGSQNVIVRGFAGGSGPGYLDGSLAAAAFNDPSDLCMTGDGALYVADKENNAIRRLTLDGRVLTIAGGNSPASTTDGSGVSATLNRPTAIACNPQGTEIYFLQSDHVLRVAVLAPSTDPNLRSSWTVSTVAGSAGVNGNALGSGTAARFKAPQGLLYASPTSLVVADTENFCLKSINKIGDTYTPASYLVSHLSGSTSGVSGFVNSTSPQSVRFALPTAVDMLPNGQLLVTDYNNHRIRLVTTSGAASTHSASGTGGYQDSASALSAKLYGPINIAATSSGYAYVSDNANGMIRRLSPSGVVSTVAGFLGSSTNADGSGYDASFSNVKGMCVSVSGDLYVIDGHRIRLIQRVINN